MIEFSITVGCLKRGKFKEFLVKEDVYFREDNIILYSIFHIECDEDKVIKTMEMVKLLK